MSDNIKEKLKNARSTEEALRIAKMYGCDTEIRRNKLNDDALENISGGENVIQETHISNSVVVIHPETGEVLWSRSYLIS